MLIASCRLCLNDEQLMDLFDIRFQNSKRLRNCILLASGVEINRDDAVSKYVCTPCRDIAIFLYKYRVKAMANDKALKEYANQKLTNAPSRIPDIAKFNAEILEELKDEKPNDMLPELIKIPSAVEAFDNTQHNKQPEVCKKSRSVSHLAVHPTVIQLVKTCPSLKIPNQLLKHDIQPKVVLNRKDTEKWCLVRKKQKEVVRREISDMERFRLKCPGISIAKIKEPVEDKSSPGLSIRKVTEPIENIDNPGTSAIKMPEQARNKWLSIAADKIIDPVRSKHSSEPSTRKITESGKNKHGPRVNAVKITEPVKSNKHSSESVAVNLTEPIKNKNNLGSVITKPSEIVKNKEGSGSNILNIIEPVKNAYITKLSDTMKVPEVPKIKMNSSSGAIKLTESTIRNKYNLGTNTAKMTEAVKSKTPEPVKQKQLQFVGIVKDKEIVDVGSSSHGSNMRNEKIESLNNNVLKKRKSSESPSDMSKKKRFKEHDGSSKETKTNTSRKQRSDSKLLTAPPVVVEEKETKTNSAKKQRSDSKLLTASSAVVEEQETKTNSGRKQRRDSKLISVPPTVMEEELPKLKIVIRKNNIEDTSRQEETASKDNADNSMIADAIEEFDRLLQSDIQAKPLSQESEVEKIAPVKLVRQNLFDSDSEFSDHDFMDTSDMGTEDLLTTVEEEDVVHCGVCNKVFTTRRQLISHERVHKVCTVCKMIFRSIDALRYHQQDVCFKLLTANLPDLQLVKVDDDPEIVKLYPSAFPKPQSPARDAPVVEEQQRSTTVNAEEVYCISDDDDDDDVVVVDCTPMDGGTLVDEYRRVRKIFRKYRNAQLAHTKQRYTETKFKINVKSNQKNQIVLENMYPELRLYRVPVQLVANETCSATISEMKKAPPPKDIYCWANEPVTNLTERNQLLSILLTPPPKQTQHQQILPKLAPAPRKPEVQSTQSANQSLRPVPTPTNLKMVSVSNLYQIQKVKQPSVIPTASIAQSPLPLPAMSTSTNSTLDMPLIPDSNSRNSVIKSVEVPPPLPPCTSTAPPPKDVFTLRVKTPWELNTNL